MGDSGFIRSGIGAIRRRAADLRDISFTLAPGSFHFLVGTVGAGKSSLLKLMYLGLRPSAGLVSLFGRDVNDAEARRLPRSAAASAWCSRISASSSISRRSTMSPCRCASPACAKPISAAIAASCFELGRPAGASRRPAGDLVRRTAAARRHRARGHRAAQSAAGRRAHRQCR